MVLRRFWWVHQNPVFLFPNRKGGLKGSRTATSPLDGSGVQTTIHRVAADCGIKKNYAAQLAPQLCHAFN